MGVNQLLSSITATIKWGVKMDQSNKLLKVTRIAQRERELPDYLAERIFVIAHRLGQDAHPPVGIDELIAQIADYDTYGQTGYLGMGVNHVILTGTIERVEGQL